MKNKIKYLAILCLGIGSVYSTVPYAVTLPDSVTPEAASAVVKSLVPGSTEPGRMSENLNPQSLTPTKPTGQAITPGQQKAQAKLGTEAERIKFKLKQIILEGEHTYSERQLSPLYKDKLGKTISVAELQQIAQDITNYYRNHGYILSRAILPPQRIAGGTVRIRVIEGFIDKVKVVGKARGARAMLQAYGERISASRPLDVNVMERYLRLANELPGVQAKAVLEPSAATQTASDLDLAAETKTLGGFFSYDNYGTRYIGPLQMTANIVGNSIFRSGDTTSMTYVTTTQPMMLKFIDISHETPLGSSGLRLNLDGNQALTQPGFVLAPLDINGNATTYTGVLKYPLIRSRDQNLTIDGTFVYLDSLVTAFDSTLYVDHIRPIRAGGSYDFSDRFKGVNLLNAHVSQGLEVLGASSDPTSLFTSRFGASGRFTKINATAARIQSIYGRFSAYGLLTGQYSFNPLLSEEQFGFGGSQLGRGYDPSEIIGDRGAAGSIELRMDVQPEWRLLQSMQIYAFYDAGVIWNIKNIITVPRRQDATSTGIGSRITFNKYLSGNLMFTQPLSKQVAALQIIGNGKCPRVFFSIVASV